METNFEIIDNNGVIHSGSQQEMEKAFYVMKNHDIELIKDYFGVNKKGALRLIETYNTRWNGDLKLIQVHQTTR